jgi:V8-like Glu-specific endopeptidase
MHRSTPRSSSHPVWQSACALLVALAITACGPQQDPPAPQSEPVGTSQEGIAGGEHTTLYPAAGYLEYQKADGLWYITCSMALVSANTVITAHHCLNAGTTASRYRVGFGQYDSGARYSVSRVIPSPNPAYKTNELDSAHDYAVLVLDRNVPIKPFELSGWKDPSELPGVVPAGRELRIIGYGKHADGATTTFRKTATVKVLSSTEHEIVFRGITGSACPGDSGGPITDLNGTKVYGVGSRYHSYEEANRGCQPDSVMEYTAVGREPFIRDSIRNNPPRPGSGPGVTAPGNTNRLNIVVTGQDRTMLHRAYDGAVWLPWESLGGGNFTSDPSVISFGGDHLDVFVRDGANQLAHKWHQDGGWSGWQSLGSPHGAGITSSPTAVSWGSGRIDVFARGSDGSLWHIAYANGQWYGWDQIGGGLANAGAAACSWGAGRLDAYVVGTDYALYHKAYDNNQWYGWDRFALPITSDPSCASLGFNNINTFYRDGGNGMSQHWWNNGWGGPVALGGSLGTAPEATRWNGNQLFIVTADPSLNAIWAKSWNPYNGWSGWTTF